MVENSGFRAVHSDDFQEHAGFTVKMVTLEGKGARQ